MALIEAGCVPAQVDKAIEKFGFAMGPFRMSDLAGNDISWAIRKRQYAEKGQPKHPSVADRLCEKGRFGQKTGAGCEHHRAGDPPAHPNPEGDDMIVKPSQEVGIPRRKIDATEIVERLV